VRFVNLQYDDCALAATEARFGVRVVMWDDWTMVGQERRPWYPAMSVVARAWAGE
jgi:hypothetical protein